MRMHQESEQKRLADYLRSEIDSGRDYSHPEHSVELSSRLRFRWWMDFVYLLPSVVSGASPFAGSA